MSAFRLQRVLDYRRRREEEMQQRHGAAVRARVEAEVRLTALIAEERRRREELGAKLGGGHIDAGDVQKLGLLIDAAGRAITSQREEVARRAAFEEEERARLAAAVSERKALDKLRERHDERERVEQNRRDALLLEEINATRSARARNAERRFPLPSQGRGPGG